VIDCSPRTFAHSLPPPLMKDGSRDTTLHQRSVDQHFKFRTFFFRLDLSGCSDWGTFSKAIYHVPSTCLLSPDHRFNTVDDMDHTSQTVVMSFVNPSTSSLFPSPHVPRRDRNTIRPNRLAPPNDHLQKARQEEGASVSFQEMQWEPHPPSLHFTRTEVV
jgi:hypothetical protein